MEAFSLLEQKISSLITLVKGLKKKNKQLEAENEQIKTETHALKAENAKLAEENAQLLAKADALESTALKGSEQLEQFNKERSVAKAALDDLIKSIDSLVERENQR